VRLGDEAAARAKAEAAAKAKAALRALEGGGAGGGGRPGSPGSQSEVSFGGSSRPGTAASQRTEDGAEEEEAKGEPVALPGEDAEKGRLWLKVRTRQPTATFTLRGLLPGTRTAAAACGAPRIITDFYGLSLAPMGCLVEERLGTRVVGATRSAKRVIAYWLPPIFDGGSPVTGYELQWRVEVSKPACSSSRYRPDRGLQLRRRAAAAAAIAAIAATAVMASTM
jgi:hypothetical protein